MKKLFLSFALALFLLSSLAPHAQAENNILLDIMLRAAACGDVEAGLAAERCRDAEGWEHISFEDLYLLSRVIYSEAGSVSLDSHWRENVGSVVMNRVDSPEFPDSISEVIFQPGQYASVQSGNFRYYTYPGIECAEIALKLIQGERYLPSYVVFQANFRQGGGVYACYISEYGATYLCISQNLELYSNSVH